ncbi:NAD-dependent epimerase/dehydratase family protein [Limnoraphis robusta]|uniref:Epimerase n=1 Tax=Limnoraphis robusta CS-951 TaxID=1637645 RepID=A0A0F5Y9B0_9CYAN|nr:NAD(P)-dependent oxidoreductase [Limnoraphis robusta]KKD35207.1 epimerase [Limnoraphis robusta CS-951]
MTKRILITGASGCIGHYIAEILIQQTDYELYFLVRNPDKLGFDFKARSGIFIIQADLRDIQQYSELLPMINIAILAATSWGGIEEVFEVNVNSSLRLIQSLNPEVCEQILYFSTASVLGRDNQMLKEAGEMGTDYVRSKYECLHQLLNLQQTLPPLRVLFPTFVFGGDTNKPYSHLSSGLPDVIKWLDLIRWLKADGGFHFIHAEDIAKVVFYFVNHPPISSQTEQIILGNPAITVNETVEEICKFYHKKIYFRFNLSPVLTNIIIKVFKIQMADWDRFCLNYRYFTYQNPVNPSVFNVQPSYPTLTEVLK